MVLRILWACLLVALVPLGTMAAEKTNAELTKDVERLANELETLRSNAATTGDVERLQEQVSSASALMTTASENLTKTMEDLSATRADVANNGQKIDRLIEQVSDQLFRQQQILEAISKTDPSGNHVLRLDALMSDSEEFRGSMEKAVNQSLKPTGSLSITNKMESYQEVLVNRTTYGISPGETRVIPDVPVGTVTVRLPGQQLTNWTIAAPTYTQSIDIVPTTSWTTAKVPTYIQRWSASRVSTYMEPLPSRTVTSYAPVYASPSVPVYIAPTTTYYRWPRWSWIGY